MAEDPKTTNQPTPDAELIAAQRVAALAKARKETAEAEKSIAESQRDKVKAELSPLGDQSKITAPSGDVTSDQAGFVETQMLAQEAAREIGVRLAKRMIRAKAKTLIIYQSAEITSLSALASALEQLEQLSREYEINAVETDQVLNDAELIMAESGAGPQPEALVPALLAAPSIATGVVKSVAELVNLFRTTTDFKNKAVTVTEDMLVSYLVKNVGDAVTVYYPALFSPNVIDSSSGRGFAVALNQLKDDRLASLNTIKNSEDVEARLTTKIMAATGAAQAKLQSALRAIANVKAKLQLLNTAVEQLTVNLETPDATSKETPLSQLIHSERLASIMKGEGAFTLRLNVTANGTTMIRKNLFTSARVQHSAGVSLVYQLFDRTGKIVKADAVQHYFEWKTATEIRELTDKNQENE